MKNPALLITALLLLSLSNFSQTISIQELIDKSNCKDTACINSWILTKGFVKNRVIENPEGKIFRYLSEEKFQKGDNKDLKAQNQLTFSAFNDGTYGIAIGTSFEPYYLLLISELDSLKFVEVNSIDDGAGTVSHIYSSPNYPELELKLQSMPFAQKGIGEWTFHNIQVFRKS